MRICTERPSAAKRGRAPTLLGVLLVVALAPSGPALAANDLTLDDGPLGHAARRDRHAQRADEAEARGDRLASARELTVACANALFAGQDRLCPLCQRARAAAAALGRTELEAGLGVAEAGLAAWRLDWEATRRGAELALQVLAVTGPQGDQLAGEGVRTAHFLLGAVALETGEYDTALVELERSRRQCEAAGDLENQAYAEIWLCRARAILNAPDARAACARGLALGAAFRDPSIEATGRWILANLELEQDLLVEAEHDYRRFLVLADAVGFGFLAATNRANLAMVLTRLGRLDEAQPILDDLTAALAAGRLPASYRFGTADALGALAAARGDLTGAAAQYQIASGSPLHWVSIKATLARAAALRRLGDLAGARGAYEEAIRRIEAERTRTPDALRVTYAEMHARPFRELIALLWDQEGAAAADQALEVAEAGRARTLLDTLRAAGYGSRATAPLPAPALRAALAPGQVAIVFVSAEDRLLAVAVTAAAVRFLPLPGAGTAAELAARVSFYRELVEEADAPEQLDAAGLRLYADLLAPILDGTPEGTAVVISADGPLHHLPFGALRLPDGRFLIERHPLGVTPSVSLLALQAAGAPAPADALAVADPPETAGLGPLRWSRAEADVALGELGGETLLLAGAAATEAGVKRAPPGRFAVLHFATHALTDAAVPLRSALVLGSGDGEDGMLRAQEIYGLKLSSAVVVLSACRTGVGRILAGEGLMSLSRAFLYAGASSVVGTLWDVDDRESAELMRGFYRELAAGAPVVSALARAQRERIAHRAPVRAWASFTVTGPLQTVARVSPRRSGRPWWLVPLGLVVGAGAGAILVARRRGGATALDRPRSR